MTTLAFFNLPAFGHLNPTLPVVKQLVSEGATVHYFVGEEYREWVERAGSRFHPLPPLKRFGDQVAQRPSVPYDNQIALMPFAMAYQAPHIVPQLVEVLRILRPDCLVYNTLSLWPRLVARIEEIPAAEFRPFHGPTPHRRLPAPSSSERLPRLAAAADRELFSLMQTFGKPPLSLETLVSQVEELVVMFVPKLFQHESGAFDDRFLFVGPSFFECPPEPWPIENDSGGKHRRAYVSLGTLRNDDPAFYRACYSAFPPDEWQVVMSVGEQVDFGVLEPIPVNFRVARSVHQTAILPQADLFITHGGLNSVMESLSFGVPMIVIPSIREQMLTARRVEDLGCGVVLGRESVTPSVLKEHACLVVSDDTMKSRLGVMRQSVRASGGYRRAADALLRYAVA